jgi:SAM-dependent MidA family methyltransferase
MPESPSLLVQALRAEIAQRGPISFRDFMARALYDPDYGYYGAGKARVGRSGDFFTNVSVGPLYGRLLARQFGEMWRHLGRPSDFVLVEQGAHSGDGASDVLTGLSEFDPECFGATTLWLVEPNPRFEELQRQTLREFPTGKIRWAKTLAELPTFRGVHYSNELVDAFPVYRVAWRGERWVERRVDFHDERFIFVDAEVSDDLLRAHLSRLPPLPSDYETEVNQAAGSWLGELQGRLEAGFILVVDYGFSRAEYYRPERTSGTLSAYAAHRREPDSLQRPGEIDLTAHVDFTSLAEAAKHASLKIAGFTDQHHFMVGLGRLHFPDDAALAAANPKDLRAFKTLMHPGLMGQSFQAFCVEKNVEHPTPLAGFQFGRDPERALFE